MLTCVQRPWLADLQEQEAAERREAAEMMASRREREAREGARVEVGPGGYCSPRHRVPFDSRDEGSKCVG